MAFGGFFCCCQINLHMSRLETKIWKYHLPGVKGINLVRVTTSYAFSDITYISVSRRSQFNIIPRHLVNIQCFLILTKRSYSSIKPGSGITVVRDEGDGGLAIPDNHRSGPISTVLPVSMEFNVVLQAQRRVFYINAIEIKLKRYNVSF